MNNGAGVVCDNQPGAGQGDEPATVLGGGSIAIHTKLRSAPLTIAQGIYVWQQREVEGTLWTELGTIKVLVD